jgi:predicted secreted protein
MFLHFDVPAARTRCLLTTAFLVGSAHSSAQAGDRALFDPIGYSHDTRYFAFEEYGMSDGTETAYSSIYVVDLGSGEFAAGSPFRAGAGDQEQEPLAEVRTRAAEAAKQALADLEVDMPAEVEALSGDGDPGPAKEMRYGLPVYGLRPATLQGEYTLSLRTFDLSPDDCKGSLGASFQGFALELSGDGPKRELYRDGKTLPEWRGCPVGYRLYAVVYPYGAEERAGAGVAIVSGYPFDFEGPSRRFVAVPIGKAKE